MTTQQKEFRRRMRLKFLTGLFAFFLVIALVWTGFYFLLGFFDPPVLLRGVGSLWASLTVLAVAAIVGGRMAGRKRPDIFSTFNDAFLRIARGDYSVQIPVDQARTGGPQEPFFQMASNLNAMTEALARMEELRKQFVADVSHEFQSPLTSVLGFARALRSDELPESLRHHYLQIIETEALRLSRLADGLLRLNALEDRDQAPDPIAFRLDVQLRRVLVALEPQWSDKGLVVEADLVELEIVGNEELWIQVWTNLIQNAIKFTPAGGSLQVWNRAGPPWEVGIDDTGIGLAADELPRVFERFYKAESSRTQTTVSGSGLGLALVQRIVNLHGATVEVTSPGLGRGTRFVVTGPGMSD